MNDLNDFPVIKLHGSEGWERGYELGLELQKRFDLADADIGYALAYHAVPGELESREITDIDMLQEGCNDGPHWIWRLAFRSDDRPYFGDVWFLEGWCDYTGWDCQSGVTWYKATEDA